MNRRLDDVGLPPAFDDAVAAAVDIDRFCSSTRWVLPAHEAFSPDTEILAWEEDRAMVAMARGWSEAVGPYLSPLEGVWGLGSPVIASDPFSAGRALAPALRSFEAWSAAMVLGLETDSPLFRICAASLSRQYRVRRTMDTTRYHASLEGGMDGYLGRRTRKFRANLRRIARRAADAGVTVTRHVLDTPAEVSAWYPTILAIERRSWKTAEGNGVAEGPMADFTLGVLRRSVAVDRALLLIARRDGEELGYLHGALDAGYFRGLQMSFANQWRELGLGSLLQGVVLSWLCELGAHTYDLGAELPYKARWAERRMTTTGLVIFR